MARLETQLSFLPGTLTLRHLALPCPALPRASGDVQAAVMERITALAPAVQVRPCTTLLQPPYRPYTAPIGPLCDPNLIPCLMLPVGQVSVCAWK